MDKPTNKNKTIGTVIGVIVAVAVSTLIRKYVFNENNNIDQQLKAVSEMTNKNCPMYVDSLTRMDNTMALPDNTFQYNYTIKIDTTVSSLSELKTNLKSIILNSVKTNPALKEFRDNSVTMAYSYNDEKGNFLFKIELSPNDYKQ